MPDRNALSFFLDSSKDVEISKVINTGAIALDSVKVSSKKNKDLMPLTDINGKRIKIPTTAYSRNSFKPPTPLRGFTADELSVDLNGSPKNSKGKASYQRNLRKSIESSDYGDDSRLSFDAKPTFDHRSPSKDPELPSPAKLAHKTINPVLDPIN